MHRQLATCTLHARTLIRTLTHMHTRKHASTHGTISPGPHSSAWHVGHRYNNEYSNRALPKEMKVTNQKASGRCWLFAALNVLRVHLREKYSLPDDFELSQTYLFFYDKLEKVRVGACVYIPLWCTLRMAVDNVMCWSRGHRFFVQCLNCLTTYPEPAKLY